MTTPDYCFSNRKQEVVHFDVNGRIFRLLRGTIERYPDSLLAQLLVEFPDFGVREKPVFVDRSSTAFEWIAEIYRDGDYESCIPEMSEKALRKELNFYQLPSLELLGLPPLAIVDIKVEDCQRQLVKLLKDKILELDLASAFPVHVWFYRRFNGRRLEKEEHIVVKYEFSDPMDNGIERSHDDFFQNIIKGKLKKRGERWYMVYHRFYHDLYGVRHFADNTWFKQFQKLARVQGISVSRTDGADYFQYSRLRIDSECFVQNHRNRMRVSKSEGHST